MNLNKKIRTGFFLLMVMAQLVMAQEKITPWEKNGKKVLFLAGKTDIKAFKNKNASWEKGDLKPVVKLIEWNKQPWIEFSYVGNKGLAQSAIILKKEKNKTGVKREKWSGISLRIYYAKDDYGKLDVAAQSQDGVSICKRITLKKGVHDYILENKVGKSKKGRMLFAWKKLALVRLLARSNGSCPAPAFMLNEITVVENRKEKKMKNLPVASIRKTLEILPVKPKIDLDGNLKDDFGGNATTVNEFYYYKLPHEVTASPFTAKITYDDTKLYIGTESQFPTYPSAVAKKRDGAVWQDEAIEYFFCPENDNCSVVQFCINSINTVFDYKTTYNPETKKYKRDFGASVIHERKTSYDNNTFVSEIAFTLSDLGIDLNKSKFCGFQLTQDYSADRKDKKLRTLSWTKTDAFPDARDFGILVFNKQPFGPGEILIEQVNKSCGDPIVTDISVRFDLKNFNKGEYELIKILVDSERIKHEFKETIVINSDNGFQGIAEFPGISDKNGTYSIYLALKNKNGDSKVFGLNTSNNVDPKNLFGQYVFCPQPKKIMWRKGRFPLADCRTLWLTDKATERTKRTANLFKKRYDKFTGIKLATHETATPRDQQGIIMKVSGTAEFDGKTVKLKKEGYLLKIEPEKIVITGADEPGLFYGGITFFQILKNAELMGNHAFVPCVDVLDWPDVHIRGVNLNHDHKIFPGSPFKENKGIEYLMEWTDRFVTDNKCNFFLLDIAGVTSYKRRPEFKGPDRIYSLDDLRKFADFCRDRFISICPQWQCGGHANWWLLPVHPELREKGWKATADVTHPEHNKIVFDCMLDVIEAIKPEYLSPKGDEWWHKKKDGEIPDDLLRGKTRAEAFRDFLTTLHGWLAEKGIKMAIYEDMLNPYHNGKRQNTYKIVDQLPKDIIILWWKGGHYLTDGLPWIISKGFNVWGFCTGFYTYDQSQKNNPAIQGFGKALYAFNNWLWTDAKNFYYYLPYTLFRTSNYGWNMKKDNNQSMEEFVESGKAYALGSVFAVQPNSEGGEEVVPLDMSSVMSDSFSSIMKKHKKQSVTVPEGTLEIGGVPMLLGKSDRNCIAIKDDQSVTVPVNRKCSALVFLHTALVNMKKVRAKKIRLPSKRDWPYGYPFGQYVVNYSDGTSVSLKLRSGVNILPLSFGPLFRYGNDIRYYYLLYDSQDRSVPLYQWKWINPHPEKEIKDLVVKGEGVIKPEVLKTVLLAVSGQTVKSVKK